MITPTYNKTNKDTNAFLVEWSYMKTLSREQRRNIADGLGYHVKLS